MNPIEELAGEALAPRLWEGREVIDVDVLAPRKVGACPETGNSQGIRYDFVEDTYKPVPGWTLDVINLFGKSSGAIQACSLSSRIAA